MRVLFISSLCSTPLLPHGSPGNARIMRAMRALTPCRMIIPVHYYPRVLGRWVPKVRKSSDVPAVEIDGEGTELLHPRTLHIPTVGKTVSGALYTASLLPLVRREIESFKPDVLLSAFAYPDGTATVALGALLGKPTVVRTMGGDIHQAARGLTRRPQISWALKRAGKTIAVSPAMGREVQELGVPADQVAVIPTGVDRAMFHPVDRAEARAALSLPTDDHVLVAPARLSSEKGLNFLLDALPQVRSPKTVRLLLVGEGAERAALEAQVGRLGLTDRVRFEGWQPEARMRIYYGAADLVCVPSLEEGWPDVLMESFACGCPVVVSRVGGMPDIVALTGAGILTEPGKPERLAEALTEGLARSWSRDETARIMERHTLAQTAERYLEACREAVARFRTSKQ
jgi:glycosyltransferase involved in cell wall biosynthesis